MVRRTSAVAVAGVGQWARLGAACVAFEEDLHQGSQVEVVPQVGQGIGPLLEELRWPVELQVVVDLALEGLQVSFLALLAAAFRIVAVAVAVAAGTQGLGGIQGLLRDALTLEGRAPRREVVEMN